ncbi:gammaproteobacterial enzyme C-terminal transmembrane domain protein [Hapalosiphon sp. MRB220]|nr:gammaproteobacterial enzyme C-terminal transmembrane domain protein [Hapalosiphon sp. MRB220]
MRLKHLFRKNLNILLLLSAILLFFATPLRNLLNQDILSFWLQRLGIWAVPIFISTYILVTVLGLPITIHTLTGGVVFGLGWGSLWSTLAATLGAVGAFCLTRYLFRDWVAAKFGQHKLLQKWHQALERHPFSLVLSLRFAPIAPFNIINFLLALTTINLKIYTLGTLIGVIPGTIAYTWLGASGKTALQGNDTSSFILASVFLVLLSVSPLLFKRKWK